MELAIVGSRKRVLAQWCAFKQLVDSSGIREIDELLASCHVWSESGHGVPVLSCSHLGTWRRKKIRAGRNEFARSLPDLPRVRQKTLLGA
jgi:hypothetical protein